MTMFPVTADDHPQNLKKKKKNSSSLLHGGGNYGTGRDRTNCSYNYNYDCFISLGVGGSDLVMAADDEFRPIENISISKEEEEEATGPSSRDNNNNHHQSEMINKQDEDEEGAGWLQLSLGSSGHVHKSSPDHHQISLTPPRRLVELDLLPPAGSRDVGETWFLSLTPQQHQLSFQVPEYHQPITTAAAAAAKAPTFLFQQHQERVAAIDLVPGAMTFTHHQHQQQYMDNKYIPFRLPYQRPSMNTTPFSSPHSLISASLDQRPPPAAAGSSSQGPFHFYSVVGPPPLRMDFRVVDPPPRPHSGVWFILQASQNQIKQPYLPQLPKSYLRIKDARTTVLLLIKYLVNKLNLDTEFEIEITCKGQQVLPFLTLQHVRDTIWDNPRRNDVVFPQSSAAIEHLMVLNYGRIA